MTIPSLISHSKYHLPCQIKFISISTLPLPPLLSLTDTQPFPQQIYIKQQQASSYIPLLNSVASKQELKLAFFLIQQYLRQI